MAGLNETPRQKMMGILYLVLLGLAATTITQQVLDSFRNLTVGLESSTSNVQSTITQAFASFSATKLKEDPVRATPYWERANRVKKACDDLAKYIADTKAIFEKECGGFDAEAGDYKQRENVDISPRIMILNKRGAEMRKLIETTRTKILAELDQKDRANFKMALNAEAPPKKEGIKRSWEENFFGDGIPLTAAITALTKINADLISTESEAVKSILGDVGKSAIVLDQFAAVAIPQGSYILLGQPYTADVFLTAFSNTINPDITVGGQKLTVKDGKGLYTVNTSREGEFKWSAVIHMKKSDGTVGEWKTEELSYRVAKPSAVVSPDKMNVFYIGVDNPVSVSAPGTPKEKLKISVTNGTVTGANGAYNIQVKAAGKVTVTITGEGEKGKSTVLGTSEFRCKRLPNPRAKFGGKTGGTVPKAQITSQNKVFASVDDFDFNVTFNINHFKLIVQRPRTDAQIFENNTAILTATMQSYLAQSAPGTRVIFDDIFATGPDGQRRSLDAMIFTVQ